MNPRQLAALVRLAAAMPGRLRRPITPDAAERALREQLAAREDRFLDAARRLIFAHPAGALCRLLRHAGCGYEELRAEVARRGLEPTLLRLRDAGVTLSHDEFKGRTPIVRPGLTIDSSEADFDTPGLKGDAISGRTSGTRGAPMRVLYDWDFLAEEAAHEVVLYRHHGVLDAPLTLWYPVLPGIAGLHNLLLNLMAARPPERWFSQVDTAGAPLLSLPRLSLAGLRVGGRLGGLAVPAPEFADAGAADRVLDWLIDARRRGAPGVLRTFVSSAVRLAARARERGVDLAGATIFAGGEPMTAERRGFLESAGARVVSRYIATEPGLIGAACREARGVDDMHLYQGRLAVVPAEGDDATDTAGRRTRLLYTTLTATTGKLLLNTDLGDAGVLSTRPCMCDFGRLGFDRHLEQVGSLDRLTLEGMTVATHDLESVVAALVLAPDTFQYRMETETDTGRARLVLALAPSLGPIDEARFLAGLYERLATCGPGPALAAQLWRDAGTVRIAREELRMSGGFKQQAHVRATGADAARADAAAASAEHA